MCIYHVIITFPDCIYMGSISVTDWLQQTIWGATMAVTVDDGRNHGCKYNVLALNIYRGSTKKMVLLTLRNFIVI